MTDMKKDRQDEGRPGEQGGGIAIHRVWPLHFADWRAHLKRLEPQSRRQRFFGAVSDAFLDSYVDRAQGDGAIVYGAFTDGAMRASSELRLIRGRWPLAAEAALSVEADWQDEGIGTALLGRAITAARNRGIVSITMLCQRENARMRHLAEKYEAELSFEEGGVTGLVAQPWPDALSILEESLRETQGLLAAVLRWPVQPPQTSLTR